MAACLSYLAGWGLGPSSGLSRLDQEPQAGAMKPYQRATGLACLVSLVGFGAAGVMYAYRLQERHLAALDRTTAFDVFNKPVEGQIVEGWIASLQDNLPVTLTQAVSIVQCFWLTGNPSIHDVDREVERLRRMQPATDLDTMYDALQIAQDKVAGPILEEMSCDGMPSKFTRAD